MTGNETWFKKTGDRADAGTHRLRHNENAGPTHCTQAARGRETTQRRTAAQGGRGREIVAESPSTNVHNAPLAPTVDRKQNTPKTLVWSTNAQVFLVNARSIINKMPDIECCIHELDPDIICITECWAHADI